MEPRLRTLVNVALAIGIGLLIWMLTAVLDRVHHVITVILIAVLFSYLVYPAVRALESRMPRGLAVLVVYVVAVGVVALGAATLAPAIGAQANDLAHALPVAVVSLQHGMQTPGNDPLLARLPPDVRDWVAAHAATAQSAVTGAAGAVGLKAFGVLRGTASALIDVVLVLALAFFFVTDVDRIRATAMRFVPRAARPATQSFVRDVDTVIGGFVRGQVLLAVVVGVLATLILFVTGVKYALLLGVLTGVASIVPIVGAIVGAVPATLVALVTVGVVKAAIVLALFVVVFEVQGHVLTPIVVGKQIGVTPLVIFLAIVVGAEAFGILGMLLAVPIAGILRVAADRFFPGDGGLEAAPPQDEALSGT